MVTGGSYSYGELFAMYRTVESLCCTPETSKTLCIILQFKKSYRSMNRLEGEMILVWDMLRVPRSEVKSIRCVILGINVEVYPDVDNWEQDQV